MLGLLTFGLGWALFALVPLTAIIYNAVTIGGPAQATVGMRVAGLKVLDVDRAAAHRRWRQPSMRCCSTSPSRPSSCGPATSSSASSGRTGVSDTTC